MNPLGMTKRIRAVNADPPALSGPRETRVTAWEGIAQGDYVRLAGERNRRYRFVAWVMRDGKCWVEIVGGAVPRGERKGQANLRCVAPERVIVDKEQTRRARRRL